MYPRSLPLSEFDIFERAPGVYREQGEWFFIFHPPRNVTDVHIIGDFTDWFNDPIEMVALPSGKFWYYRQAENLLLHPPVANDGYKFAVSFNNGATWTTFQDPAARNIDNTSLKANSRITVSDQFAWSDAQWTRPEWNQHLIYQLHLKRFTSRNGPALSPLRQVEAEISGAQGNQYIKELGATTIQLLPVNAFATDNSWGYNGTFFYAIERAYGTPDEFKQLVNTAHNEGIAVVLDIVFNHVGNGDNILWAIDRETYFSGDTDWGPMFHYGNDVCRHYLIQNLLYLMDEYHIDGFRFDMTRIIHQGNNWGPHVKFPGMVSGWNFLKELRYRAKQKDPGVLLIAEEFPNNWYVTQRSVATSWDDDRHGPFDSQWADSFHDNFKDVLRGGHLDKLRDVFRSFGDDWQDGCIYTESHDEVGNEDARIAKVARDGKGWELAQVAAAGTLLARGIPMVFMGQEGGEWTQFGQADLSWWDHRLPLDDYENHPVRNRILSWYKRMWAIRKSNPRAFGQADISIAHIHDRNGIVAFTRDHGKYLIVLNFRGTRWLNYNVGVSGFYKELANTSWPQYNINGQPETSRQGFHHHSINEVPVPAYGAIVLERY